MVKGEVKKLKIQPLILNDILAKDGLEAVSTLTGKEPYYVVGGMAVQSYIPTICRRPTSDIDFSVVRPLTYKDFKTFSRPIIEYLSDNGYAVQTKQRSRTFDLDIENNVGEKLLIEFSKRNKKSFGNTKNRLERELENAKRKIIEGRSSTCVVSAPEDIIIPKLVRNINSLIRNPKFKNNLPGKLNLSDENIKNRINKINKYREYAMMTPTDLEFAEELRFISDIYDIEILSILAGINIDYFNQASKEWRVLSGDTLEKNILFNFIPKLNSNYH